MKGSTNRRKGHDAERLYVQKFKDLGYDKCVTARFGSKLHDDCGVDLLNLPFNVQIKAGVQKGISYSQTIAYTKDLTAKKLSEEDAAKPVILIHKKPFDKGPSKDNETKELVIMTWNDFSKIISKCSI